MLRPATLTEVRQGSLLFEAVYRLVCLHQLAACALLVHLLAASFVTPVTKDRRLVS